MNATLDPDPVVSCDADQRADQLADQPADEKLAAAVEFARSAAEEVAGGAVGEHLGVARIEKRVASHAFAAEVPGYVGWFWSVTIVRARKQKKITVDEVVLLPGEGALLAPAWVPWSERIKPGDLSPGELLPPRENDPRLVPAYVQSDDPALEPLAFELGLGRERVMSREGRLDAAHRWHDGPHGPDAPMARQAPAHCGTCGFLLSLVGTLSAGFGVCANELTDTDGQVVSVEYGCGAHSEVTVNIPSAAEPNGQVYDDGPAIVPGSIGEKPVELAEPAVETEPAVTDELAVTDSGSAGAALAPVLSAEQVAEQAEDEPGERGPQPDQVSVMIEPGEEEQ